MKTSFNTSSPRNGGFTAVELLVIVIITAVLAALLWPALFITQAKSQAAQCLNNHKQLITAFLAYADSHSGNFPQNLAGDVTSGDYRNGPAILPWVNGWESYGGGTLGSDTNTQYLVSSTYTSLGPFARNPAIYKCPADRSRQFGLTGLPRVRTVSMNGSVGCGFNGTSDGVGFGSGWNVYPNEGSIMAPSPANLFVFLDENPDTINDGTFYIQVSAIGDDSATWTDAPASLHVGSTSFSFADGHVDLHHWLDPGWRMAIDSPPVYTNVSWQTVAGVNRTVDLRWLGEHTSALKAGTSNSPWPWTYVPGQ